jgi:hypothetical protein
MRARRKKGTFVIYPGSTVSRDGGEEDNGEKEKM